MCGQGLRINFETITEDVFNKYFWIVWDTIGATAGSVDDMPEYHQLLTLVSVLVFTGQGVDVAIYEVHCGGRNDPTNIFPRNIAAGFTTIGVDHVAVLGSTVQNVAWHKSGILKPGCPGISVLQDEVAAQETLKTEAAKIGAPLTFVDVNDALPAVSDKIQSYTQKMNLSLAVQLANAFVAGRSGGNETITPEDIRAGLDLFVWPGRFQVVEKGDGNSWFLDCAHNTISLPVATEWFIERVKRVNDRRPSVLIFGPLAKRDFRDLAEPMARTVRAAAFAFDMIILTAFEREGAKVWSEEDAAVWRDLFGVPDETQIATTPNVQQALDFASQQGSGDGVKALVTGSVYSVGEVLAALECSA